MLRKAFLFKDDSCIGIYQDYTCLLLVNKGTSFYYFYEKELTDTEREINQVINEKLCPYEHQFTAFVQNRGKENVKLKLNQLLLFYNSHVDEPYLISSCILKEYYEGKIFTSNTRITHVQFSAQSDFVKFESDGSVTIMSSTFTDLVQLTMSPNGVHFKITYPALLYSNEKKFEYVKLDQLFSVHYYPPRWKRVVTIAQYYYQKRYKEYSTTNIEIDLTQIFTITLPATNYPYSKEVTLSSIGFDLSTFSSIYRTLVTHSDERTSLSILSCSFEKGNNLVIEYNAYMTLKYFGTVAELTLNNEECCFLTDGINYLNFWSFDNVKRKPNTKTFNPNILPKEIFDFDEGNNNFVKVKRSIPCSFIFTIMKELLMLASNVENRGNNFIQSTLKRNKSYSSIIVKESTLDKVGKFILYKDGRIRVLFSDRTILELAEENVGSFIYTLTTNTADIIKNVISGRDDLSISLDIKKYIVMAFDFREYCKKPEEEIIRERLEEIHLKEMLEKCSEKNKMILKLDEIRKAVENQ
ncbi:hypothetical protein ABK040_009065 [Willaertia magna]